MTNQAIVPLTWTDWLVIAAVGTPFLLIGETATSLRSRAGVKPIAAATKPRIDHVNT